RSLKELCDRASVCPLVGLYGTSAHVSFFPSLYMCTEVFSSLHMSPRSSNVCPCALPSLLSAFTLLHARALRACSCRLVSMISIVRVLLLRFRRRVLHSTTLATVCVCVVAVDIENTYVRCVCVCGM